MPRARDDALVKKNSWPLPTSGDGPTADERMLYAILKAQRSPSLLATSARDGLAEVYFGIGAVCCPTSRRRQHRGFICSLALYLRPDFDRAHYLLGEIETRSASGGRAGSISRGDSLVFALSRRAHSRREGIRPQCAGSQRRGHWYADRHDGGLPGRAAPASGNRQHPARPERVCASGGLLLRRLSR